MAMKKETDGRDGPDRNDTHQWKGLAEIDRAIQENRLTEYRVKKAWSDPWIRIAGFLVAMLFIAFFGFVIWQDVL